MAYRPRPERQPVMGNGTIIATENHMVVVDGSGSPLYAERVVAGIRERSSLDVKQLVFTHWHGDHHLGSQRFVDAWPDLEIISHRFTREAMQGAPMNYVNEVRETLGPQIEALKDIASKGRFPDGSPVPAYLREDYFDLVTWGDLVLLEIQDSQVVPPNQVFDNRMVLNADNPRIELIHAGHANTAGDAMVWLPDQKILATGDIVVAPTPFGSGSYPRSWVSVLKTIKSLEPAIIIPGHGGVMHDTAYIDLLIEVLGYISEQAEMAVTNGKTLEQFRESFDWQSYPYRFTAFNPVLLSRWEQWFATPVLEAAHNEARGVENEPLY